MFGGTSSFGSAAPTFGATSFSGPTQSNPFGATQQPTTSLFGTNTGFNAPKPAFGTSFGSPQPTTSLFGGQQSRLGTGSTMFGTTSNVGPFGAPAQQVQGTSVPFTAITGTDTMMKNGVASPINTRHQCITCMKEYEQKSLEELRFEDYQLGRKGSAQQTLAFGSGQAQPTGLFSSIAPAASTTTAFGQRAPAFGTTATQPTGLFTNLNQPKPNFFGGNQTNTGFGAPVNTGFSFPTSQPQQTLFGQSAPITSTGMGAATGFSFGQPTQQPQQQLGLGVGPFGQRQMAPVATAAPAFGFAAPTSTVMTRPNTLFGTAPTFSTPAFGSTAVPASNIFSTPTKPFSFGTPVSTSAFSFSTPSTSVPAFGAGTSLFGTTTTPSTGFTGFGAAPLGAGSTGFSLGTSSLGAQQPATGFSFAGSNYGQQLNPMQMLQQPPATGPVPFPTSPYKDSPLFYNLVTNRNVEAMTKPTNPLAQRAIKEASRRRSSAALGSLSQPLSLKQMTFPMTKSTSPHNKSTTVFDGFEDEEQAPVIDILSPKTSVKKLSLKAVRNAQRLSLPLQSTGMSPLPEVTQLGSHSLTECPNTSMSSSSPNDSSSELLTNKTFEDETILESNGHDIRNGTINQSDYDLEGVCQSPEPDRDRVDSRVHDHNSDTYVPPTREEYEGTGEGGGDVGGRSKVICTVPGYYVQPSLSELDLYTDNEGNCFIRGFCVGRHNYGQVRFLDVVNVAGLNIDEIVKFRHKEVVVYPDEATSPSVGEGLNVPAEVHLVRVWPFHKKTRENIKDPEIIRTLKYEDLLRRSCERMDVEFVSYDPEEGEWVFKVKHFSKYSCVPEEDDDDEVSPAVSKIPIKGLGGLTSSQIQYNCPQIPYCQDAYEPEDEPSLMILDQTTIGQQRKFGYERTQLEVQSMDESTMIDSTRAILGNIFFPEDNTVTYDIEPSDDGMIDVVDMDTDYSVTSGYDTVADKTSTSLSSYIVSKGKEFEDSSPIPVRGGSGLTGHFEPTVSLGSNLLKLNFVPHSKQNSGDMTVLTKTFSPVQYRDGGDQSTMLVPFSERTTELIRSSSKLMEKSGDFTWPLVKKKRSGRYRRREEVERRSVSNRFDLFANLLKDPSSVHLPPRGTRVSFGSNGQFVQIVNNARPAQLVQFNGQVVLWTLETKVKSELDKGALTSYKEQVAAQLELYIENAVLINDTFTIRSPDVVSAHVAKLTKLIGDSSSSSSASGGITKTVGGEGALMRKMKEEREVWKLLEILSSNGNNGFLGRGNQYEHMAQRGQLGKWLQANGRMLFGNLYNPDDLSVKGLLLKGLKQEAGRQAIRDRNYTLALCLVQHNKRTQGKCRSQLEFWKQEDALEFVGPTLREIYSLCAGYPIWTGVHFGRMMTSEWLQHFATFIWYLSPIHYPIDKIVGNYQATVRKTAGDSEPDFSAPARETAEASLSNLCIHLLKLYSSVGYPLNRLLSPGSHTEDGFDYKVSWCLMIALLTFDLQVGPGLVESVVVGLAQQLELLGMWEWSVFVLKFLPATEARQVAIKRLLERELGLGRKILPEAEILKKIGILERIGIPEKLLMTDDLERGMGLEEGVRES